MKNKDNAFIDYLEMIKKSWTYDRMTQEEKEKLEKLLNNDRIKDIVKGTYQQRWEILNGVYYAFLVGIGYNNEPDWRGVENEN